MAIIFSIFGNFQVLWKGTIELKEKAMKYLQEIILVANSGGSWSDREYFLEGGYRVLSLRTWELYESPNDFQY